MTDEGDELGRGMAVRISGNNVADVLNVVADLRRANAACTLAMALVQHVEGSRKMDSATGRWVPMSDDELKKYLAGLTSQMLDHANKSDLWRPLRAAGIAARMKHKQKDGSFGGDDP